MGGCGMSHGGGAVFLVLAIFEPFTKASRAISNTVDTQKTKLGTFSKNVFNFFNPSVLSEKIKEYDNKLLFASVRSAKTVGHWYTKRAMLHILARDDQAALKDVQSAVEQNPNNAEAWTYYGTLNDQVLNHAKALECYAKAIEAFAKNPQQYNEDEGVVKGTFHAMENSMWNMKDSMLGMRDNTSKWFTNTFNMGSLNSHITAKVSEDDMLREAITKAESQKITLEEVMLLHALALYNCGKVKDCITEFEALFQKQLTDESRFVFQYALCLFYAREWKLACNQFAKIIKINDARFLRKCYAFKAYAETALGDTDLAKDDWQKAKELGVPRNFLPFRLLSNDVLQLIFSFLSKHTLRDVVLVCRFMRIEAQKALSGK